MANIIYLSKRDIESLSIPMREVISAVDEGFKLRGMGLTDMPPKPDIHPRESCYIHAMPAYVGGDVDAAGIKWISGYITNPKIGLPYINGLLVLNDAATGLPIAVMDCSWITAMRTAAATAVAVKYMANLDTETASIMGLGVQGRTNLMALAEILPGLKTVKVMDANIEMQKSYVESMSKMFPHISILKVDKPEDIVRGSGVIVSAIPISEDPKPPFQAGWLEEGALACPLDYDAAWSREAMEEFDKFVCDDRNQLLRVKERGPYFKNSPSVQYQQTGDIAAGLAQGRESRSEKIYVQHLGIAIHDIVTAKLIFNKAKEKGAGVNLPL